MSYSFPLPDEFPPDYSDDLDDWAASTDRVPLVADLRLAGLLATDRDRFPYRPDRYARVMWCADCRVRMRPKRASVEEFPGSVEYGGRGRCSPCYHHEFRTVRRAS